MSQNQKKQWSDEAKQLQKDLKNRPKKVVRRKVDIKMSNGKKRQNPTPNNSITASFNDDFLRKQLGL